MVGIYKITNKINGKVYIGQSINIAKRWKAHRTRPFNPNSTQYNSFIYKAIRKYGLDNFTFEVIEECLKKDLNEREKFYIQQYDSMNPDKGYNLTAGGYNSVTTNNKLTSKMVDEIYDLLMHSTFTQQEIAEQFGVSQRTISGINLGEQRMKPGYSFPLSNYRPPQEKQKNVRYCKICGAEISYKAEL